MKILINSAFHSLILLLLVNSGTSARAAITFRDLNPSPRYVSSANAVSATQAGGYVGEDTGTPHAALWSGSAASFVDLNPEGAHSYCCGLHDSQQVGWCAFETNQNIRAALWSGSAESHVDLHPNWADRNLPSKALFTTGSRQFGTVYFNPGTNTGTVWTGTAASAINLEAEATAFWAEGGEPNVVRIGGYKLVWGDNSSFTQRALLWSDGAATPTDLHPIGWDRSYINALSESNEVGLVLRGDVNPPVPPEESIRYTVHAALWSGTELSFVDLHPDGTAGESRANGVFGPFQVGEVLGHAALWSGSARSFIDLNSVLPTNYPYSEAKAVWTDGTLTRVVGYATGAFGQNPHAILWEITDLRVSPTRDKLVVSWPDATQRYALQQASSLSLQDWTSVVETPSSSNGTSTVTVPVRTSAVYFRLQRK